MVEEAALSSVEVRQGAVDGLGGEPDHQQAGVVGQGQLERHRQAREAEVAPGASVLLASRGEHVAPGQARAELVDLGRQPVHRAGEARLVVQLDHEDHRGQAAAAGGLGRVEPQLLPQRREQVVAQGQAGHAGELALQLLEDLGR